VRRAATAAFVLLAAAAALAAAAPPRDEVRPPGEVIRYPGADESLTVRVAWAIGEAGGRRGGEFWVGYSISRLMGRHSTIGSVNTDRVSRELTVREILAGVRSSGSRSGGAEDIGPAARRALDKLEREGEAEAKVAKDIGIFLLYPSGRTTSPAKVRMSDLDLAFDFEGAPLYWLGKASDARSLGKIESLFARAGDDKVKRQLIAAAGIHAAPRLVVRFLEGILAGPGPDGLRKDAAFWIGQQNDAAGLRLLVNAARSDRSTEVREASVFGISQVGLPEAVDELIGLARGADDAGVRKQAVFWLGQAASKKAAPALEDFATGGRDIEVQKQAVFALSQLPGNQGLEPLIRLAKTHPDPRIRKKAVFWLGECRDPRALQTLIEIIKGK